MTIKEILFFIFFLFNIGYAACVKVPDISEPDIQISLSGHLLDEEEWGRPNFGSDPAHDEKYKIILLKLDTPLEICNPEDTLAGLKTLDCIQIGNSCDKPLKPYTGEHIAITGDAFGVDNGWKLTPLVMNCKEFKYDKSYTLTKKELSSLKNYRCQSTEWTEQRVNSPGSPQPSRE